MTNCPITPRGRYHATMTQVPTESKRCLACTIRIEKTQRQKLDKLAQHYEIAANRFHPGHPQLPVTLININIALLSKVLA